MACLFRAVGELPPPAPCLIPDLALGPRWWAGQANAARSQRKPGVSFEWQGVEPGLVVGAVGSAYLEPSELIWAGQIRQLARERTRDTARIAF
jgi:hypothetical protein